MKNLRAGGFKGPLYAANPHHASLDVQPVFARVAGVPRPPDLHVLGTWSKLVAALADRSLAHVRGRVLCRTPTSFMTSAVS